MTTPEEARKILEDAGQSHVLAFWDRLDASAREGLLAQVARIDFAAVAKLRGVLAGAAAVKAGEIHTVTLDYLMSNDGT
ncbi:MAG: hypothetical protein IJL06_10540, partial [Kiritimatiellae bacterium]|nr:hypothetical protein [Kiritimatiellia bacterium]